MYQPINKKCATYESPLNYYLEMEDGTELSVKHDGRLLDPDGNEYHELAGLAIPADDYDKLMSALFVALHPIANDLYEQTDFADEALMEAVERVINGGL